MTNTYTFDFRKGCAEVEGKNNLFMSDVLRFSKKLFTLSVVAMTIAWAVGLNLLIPAGNVSAATYAASDVEAGDLIKLADQSSVYFVNEDMQRMYFAFGWLYKTWFSGYDAIKTLPAGSDLDEHFPPASRGAVSPRPGSCETMKSPASPSVYMVSYGGVRHKIASEAAAVALCGAEWAKHVHDLPDFVISLFPIGGEVDGMSPVPGQLIRSESNGPVYVVGEDSKAYAVDGSLPAFLSSEVRLVSQAQWDALVGMGEGTRTVASLTADVAQLVSTPNDNNNNNNNSTSTSTGDLKVSLAGNTAEADVVPGGAQNVEYLSVVLQAVGGDVDVDSLTFHRGGVGDNDDFNKVYLYHNGVRLENGRTLNNDDEVTFNVNLRINSGDSETLVVKADMDTLAANATNGDQNRFELVSKDSIEASGADVSGSFPIRGNLLVVGSQDTGTVTVDAGGTDANVKIGQNDVKVGEFDLTASTTDINVTSITLQQKGSINMSALSNIVLKRAGVTIATGEVVGDDRVQFTFDASSKILDGDQATYRVYADVGVTDLNDTIQFVLDESSDLNAWSSDNSGFEVGVTNNLTTGAAMELTVEGGKINVDFDGNSADVRQDQNDASFGTFTILATAEDIDVNTLDLVLHKNVNTYVLEDMKLRDKNGHGTFSLTVPTAIGLAATSSTVRLEDITLQKGVKYEFEVLGDVNNTATSGASYYFSFAAASVDASGVTSDNTVQTDDFSSAALTGPTMDVNTSSLVVRSSALSDDTVVNGTKNVLLYRGTLEAGATSDVTITSMTFSTSSLAGEDWSNRLDGLKLFIVGLNDTVDPTKTAPVSTDNTVTTNEAMFDSMDVTVQKGSANRMKLEVYGDITDGSTTGDVSLELTAVDASDVDDVAVDAEGSTGVEVATTAIASDRVITIAGAGTLTMVVDTDYTTLKNDRFALAGTAKFLAGRIKLVADNEDVNVNDLSIRFVTTTGFTNTTTMESSIDTISLYSDPSMADNKLLGTADWSASTTIQDVGYTVTNGQTAYLYVGLKLNSIGTEADGTAVASTSFKFKVDATGMDVTGASSNDDITPTLTFTLTNDIAIVPVKITDVSSDFAGGSLVGGNQIVGSFKVTADAGRNTDSTGDSLSAHLLTLGLQLSTDVGTATDVITSNTSAMQLCRVDSGNCIDLGSIGGSLLSATNTTITLVDATTGTSTINMSLFGTSNVFDPDEYVDSGETAEFVVKATMANTVDHFAQVKVLNLNSSGLKYGVDTDGDGTDDYTFTDIRKDAPRGTDYPSVTSKALN